jgi:hypothetical protein
MSDDFKDYPPSITELKSERTKDAADWTPRDALICLLREIDSGQTIVTELVIAYVDKVDPSKPEIRRSIATSSRVVALGLFASGIKDSEASYEAE